MKTLTFTEFRKANLRRCYAYHPNGVRHWTPAEWVMALTGELGELAKLLKKTLRGGFTQEMVQQEIADELADVQTYLDLLAARLGVDLGSATVAKFNRVSDRVGSIVKLAPDEELVPPPGSRAAQ